MLSQRGSYDLSLTPDLEAFTFHGSVDIQFDVAPPQKDSKERSITLHAKELCFSQANIVGGAAATEIHVNLKATTVTFLFDEDLPSQPFTLRIQFTGFLNNQMAGFYRSSYTNIHGETKTMASTQFESLDARRCFPCVDEPASKAVFRVALTIPNHLQCLSNMPVARTESLGTTRKVSFLDTPKMSTYLLAMVVGEFDCVQTQTTHGVLVSVYTPPGQSQNGSFALETAARALDVYDDFFGVPYPLPKLDMVAIPEFAAGAMENWGLVTYRQVDLLIDAHKASKAQQQRVAIVVTHELAHQWFGNLVTMQWWDDLWLNEGFASWAENWNANVLYPEYRLWDQFTTDHLSSALKLDALQSSHPIQVPIAHAEEVEQVFDAISYCKGGSVVRMIQAVLGMQNFQKGLANYMQKHAYGNTETYDLWSAWEQVSQLPVAEMMASWTEQMGFPMLKVVKEDWQADKVVLELEQSWFLSDGSELDDAGKAKLWTIPILTCTNAGPQADMTLMREKTASISIPLTSADGWVKVNADHQVPMRVLPSEKMLERLSNAAQSKALSPIDRAGLINDTMALVKAGQMSPESLLKLLSHFSAEDDYIVWKALSEAVGALDTVMSDDKVLSPRLQKFAKKLVLQLEQVVGWSAKEGDGHLSALLRSLLIGLLSKFAFDDTAVVAEARRRFQAFLDDHDDVENMPGDIRPQVFSVVLQNGGEKEYSQIKDYYYSASDNAERKHVLNSLGNIPDEKLKVATMDWAISGEIKIQDFFYLMGSVGRSGLAGRQVAWQYFKDNFSRIESMVSKASPSIMGACIVMCAGGFCSREMADEIDAFFETHPVPLNTRKISQTTENMRSNAKFMDTIKASALATEDFWASL